MSNERLAFDGSMSRRTALKGATTTALGLSGLGGVVSGTPGSGNPSRTNTCDLSVPDDFTSIQDAVDAASPGDTVCVTAGTYAEQVVVDKDLTLRGVGNPVVVPPSAPGSFTIPENDDTWEPVVFAYGGEQTGDAVSGTETIDVTIEGFVVDGAGRQPAANRAAGILCRNVVGNVRENTVQNLHVGGRETFGILVYGDSTVAIHGNDVSGYERGGIGANGDGGAHPAPTVDVRSNVVTGTINDVWGPNGIQIGFGADGTIIGNTVADNRYRTDLESFQSAGIILYGSSGITVAGNEVTNSDIGVATALAGNNRIDGNVVSEANIGVYLLSVDNNKLVNNEITDSSPDPAAGDIGVLNTGTNNKLINNRIAGFDVPITDLGTDAKIHATK